MHPLTALALVASAITPTPDPKTDAQLAPASKWQVDYADNACNIGRVFGSGDRRILLGMKVLPGRGNTVFVLEENRPGKSRIQVGELAIKTSPEAAPISVQVISGSAKAGSHVIHGSLSSDELSAIARADAISFVYREKVIRLTGVNLKAALAASIACEDDLLRTWGVDAPAFRAIAVHAQPVQSPARWITNNDYPAESLRAGEEGSVSIRLDVSATGEVAACTILSSSRFQRLDQTTCQIMRERARYQPAQLADGTPTASLIFLRFRWQMTD